MLELRFVPDVTQNLDSMFKAMNECQLLHPDPDDSPLSDDEEEDDDEEAEEGDEYDVDHAERLLGVVNQGTNGDDAQMDEEEEEMQVQGQFDDAD